MPARPRRRWRHVLRAAALPALLLLAVAAGQAPPAASSFAERIAALSEPGGFFDTDNLISNERSYLQVVPDLAAAGLHGGAYIGVGPDQNFSYIARLRPSIAFIVDVRRDNLLLHLLFKALFAEAPTRVEYLSLLFGRAPPPRPAEWRAASVERLASWIDAGQRSPARTAALDARLDADLAKMGVPLSTDDLATMRRFHHAFIDAGLGLRFESLGRAPRSYYPTYRDLLMETDPGGSPRHFLASEADYAFVRSLEQRDLVVPVVGDLSGPSAIAAIGRLLTERGETVSAFYTSNVEFYLFGRGTFARFVANLRRLPRAKNSLIIRSVFDGYARAAAPGYASASVTEPIDDLLDGYASGRIGSYRDLAMAGNRPRD